MTFVLRLMLKEKITEAGVQVWNILGCARKSEAKILQLATHTTSTPHCHQVPQQQAPAAAQKVEHAAGIKFIFQRFEDPGDARSPLTPVPGTCSAILGQISAMDLDGAGVVA